MKPWVSLPVVRAIPVAVILGVLVLAPLNLPDARIYQMTGWIPLAIAALSLNLLTGYNGQISLGHAALYGAGAYAFGLLVTNAGWPMWLAVAGAAVISFAIGIVVGLPALRIKGLYLAIVTLALAVMFPALIKAFPEITGGGTGFRIVEQRVNSRGVLAELPPRLEPPGFLESGEQWTFYLFSSVAVVCFVLVRNLMTSRAGRSIIAIRDNEVAAETNGVNVAYVKVMTFGISAALAGVGGALFAIWQTQFPAPINPSSFVLVASLYFLVAVVVGGAASTLGPAIGAFFVGFFQDVVTKDWMPARIQPATPLILGALLIVLMLVAPGGIAGLTRQTLNRVQMSWQRRAALQSTDQGES